VPKRNLKALRPAVLNRKLLFVEVTSGSITQQQNGTQANSDDGIEERYREAKSRVE